MPTVNKNPAKYSMSVTSTGQQSERQVSYLTARLAALDNFARVLGESQEHTGKAYETARAMGDGRDVQLYAAKASAAERELYESWLCSWRYITKSASAS